MFVAISLKHSKAKWKAICKIALLIGFLAYVIPKLVLAVTGVSHPPANPKLRETPLRETPMRVEIKFTAS